MNLVNDSIHHRVYRDRSVMKEEIRNQQHIGIQSINYPFYHFLLNSGVKMVPICRPFFQIKRFCNIILLESALFLVNMPMI